MTLYRRLAAALAIALALLIYIPARAETPSDYDMGSPERLSPEHLYAQCALLVDEDSGETLFSKNSRVRMYPASTTKIMTLLLALESGIGMDERVTVPAEAADIAAGSSVIPVYPGDELTFSDLLYGFMLTSGNDGANAIAVLVDGDIESFVARMNARAAELGCEGTHYVNAHGYHDAEHYTTAADLARISRHAMQNDAFRAIVGTPNRVLTIQRNGATENVEVVNRNSLLISGDKYYYPDCTGIKTGHHNKAGWCFVGSAQRDGMRVICVVLNCELEEQKWYDAARLFEYGFTCYTTKTVRELLEEAGDRYKTVQVENADGGDPMNGLLELELSDLEGGEQALQLVAGNGASMEAALERVRDGLDVEWTRPVEAPVEEGERLATLTLTLDDGLEATASLVATRSVSAPKKGRAASKPKATDAATANPGNEAGKPARGRVRGALPLILCGLLAIIALAGVALWLSAREAKRRRRSRRRRRRRR